MIVSPRRSRFQKKHRATRVCDDRLGALAKVQRIPGPRFRSDDGEVMPADARLMKDRVFLGGPHEGFRQHTHASRPATMSSMTWVKKIVTRWSEFPADAIRKNGEETKTDIGSGVVMPYLIVPASLLNVIGVAYFPATKG